MAGVRDRVAVVTGAGNTIRSWCCTYGFSPAALWREHVRELTSKGFIQPRQEGRRNAKSA